VTPGVQATLALVAAVLGWTAVFSIGAKVPGMNHDKFRKAVITAAWSAVTAMLPIVPDLLADEPVLTPRSFARMAVSAFVGALAANFKMPEAKTEPEAKP
jgi:hypothetical protein